MACALVFVYNLHGIRKPRKHYVGDMGMAAMGMIPAAAAGGRLL